MKLTADQETFLDRLIASSNYVVEHREVEDHKALAAKATEGLWEGLDRDVLYPFYLNVIRSGRVFKEGRDGPYFSVQAEEDKEMIDAILAHPKGDELLGFLDSLKNILLK
jgi:hypothetical protein